MASDLPTLRQQLRQLKELHEAGALETDLYQQSRQSLERRIVDAVLAGDGDVPAVPPPVAPAVAETRRAPARLWLAVGAVVVLLAGAGYWWTGSPGMASAPRGEVASMGGNAAEAQGAGAPPHALENDQVQAMVDKLAQRLKDTPNDAEGWAMLARSYAVIGRHADAVPAYKKALALRPDDASLMADYADALAVVNQHQLAGEPMTWVKKALGIDPNNLKALSLAGTAAFDQKDYATAVKHWDHIMAVAPAGSSYLPQVQANLAEARALGQLPTPPAATAAPTSAAAGGSSVSGTVTLAAALRDRVAPTDTVFVFARAAEGPRMPLAILRKQVKDLPLEFKLDDSLAMSPAARLSAYPQVVVGARISKSGNAMPQPGDLSGQTPVTALGASGLKVEISQAVTTP